MLFSLCDSLHIQAYCYSCINIFLMLINLFHNFWNYKVFLYLHFLNMGTYLQKSFDTFHKAVLSAK